MGFLLAPNYPYLRHFIANRQATISNADRSIESHKTLIGDIAYLSATIKRATDEETQSNKKAPLPETNNSINHLVFISPTGIVFTEPLAINKDYLEFVKAYLPSVYLKIPSPPPEIIT